MNIVEQLVETSTVAAIMLPHGQDQRCVCNQQAAVLLGRRPTSRKGLTSCLAPDDDSAKAWDDALTAARQGQEAHLTLPRPRNSSNLEEMELVVAPCGRPGVSEPDLLILLRCAAEEKRIQTLETRLVRLTAVGQLAWGAGHELNNILTTILGWAQIALRPPLREEKQQSALAIIEEHCTRAKELIDDVAGMARQHQRRPERVALADTVDGVLRLLTWDFNHAGVVVKRKFSKVPPVLIDRSRLFHALLNLLNNAVQSMPDGGELTVTTSTEGGQVHLELRDTGPGMDPDTMALAFEPHFSTRPRTGMFVGGAGMGLTISLRLLKAEGGRIEVASDPGQGTRFTVILPAATPVQVPPSQQAVAPERLPAGLEILIVENQADLRNMLREALEQEDQVITTAANGIEALALCRRRRFEVALLDATMPGATGPVLADKLRELGPAMKIFLVSGQLSRPPETPSVNGVLHKPFTVQELCKALHAANSEDPQPG